MKFELVGSIANTEVIAAGPGLFVQGRLFVGLFSSPGVYAWVRVSARQAAPFRGH